MLGRIKTGTEIVHNGQKLIWPECYHPKMSLFSVFFKRDRSPEMVFEVKWDGHCWVCQRDGYGRKRNGEGAYGKGPIRVFDKEAVEVYGEEVPDNFKELVQGVMKVLYDMEEELSDGYIYYGGTEGVESTAVKIVQELNRLVPLVKKEQGG